MTYYQSILERVDTDFTNECWVWHKLNSDGYGRGVATGSGPYGMKSPHVLALEFRTGIQVPKGLQVDHLCLNKACWNPKHLEVVSPQVNNIRRIQKTKTHCAQGHEWNKENIIRNGRSACCKICRKEKRSNV